MTRVFKEPRDNEVVYTRAGILEAEIGERDKFEYADIVRYTGDG